MFKFAYFSLVAMYRKESSLKLYENQLWAVKKKVQISSNKCKQVLRQAMRSSNILTKCLKRKYPKLVVLVGPGSRQCYGVAAGKRQGLKNAHHPAQKWQQCHFFVQRRFTEGLPARRTDFDQVDLCSLYFGLACRNSDLRGFWSRNVLLSSILSSNHPRCLLRRLERMQQPGAQ